MMFIVVTSDVIVFPGPILIVRGSGHALGVGGFHHQRRYRVR